MKKNRFLGEKRVNEKTLPHINGGTRETRVGVNTTSGALGAPINVRIRGTGSVNGDTEPLF